MTTLPRKAAGPTLPPFLFLFLLPFLFLGWTPGAAALDFHPCPDAALPGLRGSLCARVAVPARHDAGAAGAAGVAEDMLTLFVRKFPAAGPRRGSVWAIAGGPGESGASLYPFVDVLRRAFPGVDVIVPDHRGTGLSSRLCPAEEAPDSPGGTALAGAEWGSCLGALAAHPERALPFTVTNAAHDLAALLAQDDDGGPVYLYGVSYGTQLVLRTLRVGRPRVAGVVLDSLVPPETDARWDLSRRSHVVDDVGRQVLARCDAAPDCAAMLGAPGAAVLRRVLDGIDPALLARVPGKDLRQFLGALLDVPPLRARIPALLADLARGGDAQLQAVLAALPGIQAQLGDYPQTPPSIPLTGIVSLSENDLRPGRTPAQVRADEAPLLLRSPLPALLAGSTLPRYPRDGDVGALPDRLPPTLVLHGTLDPKTHHDGALAHLALLRERGPAALVDVVDAPHFILWTAPDCFVRHVRPFVDGAAPAAGRCAPAAQEIAIIAK
ncbi:alpha/beta fold hydrolase [uncultured Massilia sp.]|uniref:alpha/beta fold hydrolase n=1 Tax=uncultured Massilia sp. TaxID=169973 RepID=UPI0025EEA5D1|nr:alpha/beta fold hydrolase [uncultured Massilia sp.]